MSADMPRDIRDGLACPWYGQSDAFAGRFVPRQGNRCALITSAHSPCWMEVGEHRNPDWAACPRNPEWAACEYAGLDGENPDSSHDRKHAAMAFLAHRIAAGRHFAAAKREVTPPS